MKIKIGESWGTAVDRDLQRVRQLRKFAGADVALMVDANGGYTLGQARRVGRQLDELGVVWFEEPVTSDHLDGLAAVRGAGCDVTAGEYAGDVFEAPRLCAVVDCLQLDVTRCGGYTGWLRCAAIADAHGLQVSGHCAPSLHAPVAAATRTCGTSSGSSTTPAWNRCWSTARRRSATASWCRTTPSSATACRSAPGRSGTGCDGRPPGQVGRAAAHCIG